MIDRTTLTWGSCVVEDVKMLAITVIISVHLLGLMDADSLSLIESQVENDTSSQFLRTVC